MHSYDCFVGEHAKGGNSDQETNPVSQSSFLIRDVNIRFQDTILNIAIEKLSILNRCIIETESRSYTYETFPKYERVLICL